MTNLADDNFLAELKAGLDKATPGSWTQHTFMVKSGRHTITQTGYSSSFAGLPSKSEQCEANPAPIARCSPDRIRALLTRLEAAERDVKVLREAGEDLCAAACEIHPTAPSHEAIEILHAAIHLWGERAAL